MNYLIVIPARGGSKGIPDKNIIDIGGKPLIAYSIEVALQVLTAGVSGKMLVSTDSERIAGVARSCGADVPFLRPAEISGDRAKSADFLIHAVNYYIGQKQTFDAIILLQPTSPLRTLQDVLQAVRIYETAGQSSLISAYREDYICDLVCYKRDGDIAIPQNPAHNTGVPRQQHDKIYVRNGAIYITSTDYLLKEQKVICGTPAMYEMPKSRSVNLDTPEDLELLRWILK